MVLMRLVIVPVKIAGPRTRAMVFTFLCDYFGQRTIGGFVSWNGFRP